MQVGEGHATPVGITGVLRGAVGVGVGVVVQVINGAEQMAPRMGDGWWAGGGCSGAEQCRSVRGVRLRSTTPQGRGVALQLLMGLDGCARAWGRVMPGSSPPPSRRGVSRRGGRLGRGGGPCGGRRALAACGEARARCGVAPPLQPDAVDGRGGGVGPRYPPWRVLVAGPRWRRGCIVGRAAVAVLAGDKVGLPGGCGIVVLLEGDTIGRTVVGAGKGCDSYVSRHSV